MNAAKWMTIPAWRSVRQIDVFRREQVTEPLSPTNAPENLHVLVRGTLQLPDGDCVLRISADDYYYAWLDGTFLGCGPAPAYPGNYCYQEYPITGGRSISIALHLYYQGLINRVFTSGDGRFGLYLTVLQNGKETACCDEDWKYEICRAYSGEKIGYDTQFLENFDSGRYPEGWEEPGFDDSGWDHLTPAAWADYRLQKQPIANLQWTKLAPVKVVAIPGGMLLDFGKEITGKLSCQATGKTGQKVFLRFGEELEAGRVKYDMRCNCRYEEIWTLRDGNSMLHPFDYKAFRYAEILPQAGVQIGDMFAWVRHYPMGEECSLRCETDQLGEIFEICKNAVRCATQEGFLDCPSREKGQYLGDAVITARSHLWLTGDSAMLRKCIRDFMATADISPGLMAVAPCSLMQEIADYSLMFPMLVMTDHEFTGDREFLAECYPTVAAVTECFEAYARPDGLLENVSQQWNLVDWPESCRDGYDFPLTRPVVGQGCHNVVNALYYGAWRMREEMEQLLGYPSRGHAKQLAAAFQRAFYREQQSLFADSEGSNHCSLHANIYAAYFGLLTDADAFEALVLQRHCGVLPMFFALRALGKMKKYNTVYRLLTREDEYGWRNMLRQGATACFEAWGKEQKWNTSLCHPWASGAISIMIEELAGLRPGSDRLEFEPHMPEHLDQFELTVPFRGKRYRINGKELFDADTPNE